MNPKVYRLVQLLIVAAIIILNIVFLGKVPYYGVSNPIYLFFSISYVLVLLLGAFFFGKGKGFFILVLIYWGILFFSYIAIDCVNLSVISSLMLFPYFYLARPLYEILVLCELLPYHLGSILFFILVYAMIVIAHILGKKFLCGRG